MKVCFVITPIKYGGGENLLVNLAKSYKRKGIEISFINLTKSKELEETLKKENLGFYTVSNIDINFSPSQLDYLLLSIKLIPYIFLKRRIFNNIDVIHIHGFPANALIAFLKKVVFLRKNFTLIYTHHSEKNYMKEPYRLVYERILNIFDYITCVGFKANESMIKIFPKLKEKIIQIDNGIDLSEFKINSSKEELKRRLGFNKQDIIGIYVARFSPAKNHLFLLKILKDIKNKRFKIIMLGNGRMFDVVKNKAKELGLEEGVVMPGFISNKKIAYYLKAADFCLFPSKKEGFGISIIEAMATGLPVVMFESVFLKSFGKGILVAKNNEDFFRKTKKLIYNNLIRKELSSLAKNEVKKFDINEIAIKYLKLYKNIKE